MISASYISYIFFEQLQYNIITKYKFMNLFKNKVIFTLKINLYGFISIKKSDVCLNHLIPHVEVVRFDFM